MEWTLTAKEPGKVCLLQGNEAIVRGCVEAGVNFAASYPGSPSSQILTMLGNVAKDCNFYAQWSINEVVALQSCIGASLAGARSICVVKQNGLLCTADALHCGAQHGVIGGLVIVTSDDPSAHSSTNEFDSRHMAISANLPLLEPTNMQEAKDMVKYAFELSEKYKQMVILRLTTRVCHGRGSVVLGEIPETPHEMRQVNEWDRMCCVSFLHEPMLEKLDNLQDALENCPYNHYQGPAKPKKLIIAEGTGHLYAKEALNRLKLTDEIGLLSLAAVWPLPEKLIKKYIKSAKEILVLEEVDPVLERNIEAIAGKEGLKIKFMGRGDGALPRIGELNPDQVINCIKVLNGDKPKKIKAPAELLERDLAFCAGCPHRATFFLLKKVMRKQKNPGIVIGDIGCYIMSSQPTGQYAYQACNCMGSGVNLAQGIAQLQYGDKAQKVVTMSGDSTFFHTIIPGLLNAKYHNANMLLMVLDNSATAMTGFQPHPGTGITAMGDDTKPQSIKKICESMGVKVFEADPFELDKTEKILTDALKEDGCKVLIMKQPCATLMNKSVIKKPKVYVDQNLCKGDECGCDKFCSRVWGCPGNVWDFKNGKATIDPVQCVGCGVCADVCPNHAIKVEGGRK